MIFTKHAKNDPPLEGKKFVFLRFFGWKARFPRENNAILHCCFHGVSLFRLGLILGVFWGFLGALLGARGTHWDHSWATWRLLGCLGWLLGSLRDPRGTNLGFSWVALCLLGSLVMQIWAMPHQLGDFVSLGVRFGFFWVSGLRIKSFCPIFGGHRLSLWILVNQV